MNTHMDMDGERFVSTYGGCFTNDCGTVDDYGFSFSGDVSVDGISGVEFSRLAVEAINHLMNNGHDFEFGFDKLSGQKELEVSQ